MSSTLIFIYDGQCPFCKHFAELIELKSNLPDIQIKDARKDSIGIPNDYDMDINGAILLKGNEMFQGAKAINWICSQINEPSDALLKILSITFSSRQRTYFLFPFLLISRRIALYFKGIPRKIIR